MPESQTKWWSFLQGVGGIVTGVLTAVLAAVCIAHFIRPTPTPIPVVPTVSPTTAPPPATIALNGMIADAATQKPVGKAAVKVQLGQDSAPESTDAEGRYAYVFGGDNPAHMATISVTADGYQPYSSTLPVDVGNNFAEIALVAVVPPTPVPGQPGPVITMPALKPGIVLNRPPENYMLKRMTTYVGIKP